jgi:short-subunit dehydrogenase
MSKVTLKLKPLKEQVIVITGASSGIGLVTAREAAKAGARVVVCARDGEALETLAKEINDAGGQAVAVEADVSKCEDLERVAKTALGNFGGFDTWVNNAGVSIYGRLEEVELDDMRSVFETNFWGLVHGSRVAMEHLKENGGALINIGSTLSERSIPMQGIYVASKFAVRGFTDALRMEAEEAGYPVSVTLIKPAAIDTPYVQHAKNYMDAEPKNPPPVYAPETVARAILHCAQKPERDVSVGGASVVFQAMEKFAPWLTDKSMELTMVEMQKTNQKREGSEGNSLEKPSAPSLQERGGYEGKVWENSAYTQAFTKRWPIKLALLGAGALVYLAKNRK